MSSNIQSHGEQRRESSWARSRLCLNVLVSGRMRRDSRQLPWPELSVADPEIAPGAESPADGAAEARCPWDATAAVRGDSKTGYSSSSSSVVRICKPGGCGQSRQSSGLLTGWSYSVTVPEWRFSVQLSAVVNTTSSGVLPSAASRETEPVCWQFVAGTAIKL